MRVRCIARYPLQMLPTWCSISNTGIAAAVAPAIKVVTLEVVIMAVVAIIMHHQVGGRRQGHMWGQSPPNLCSLAPSGQR